MLNATREVFSHDRLKMTNLRTLSMTDWLCKIRDLLKSLNLNSHLSCSIKKTLRASEASEASEASKASKAIEASEANKNSKASEAGQVSQPVEFWGWGTCLSRPRCLKAISKKNASVHCVMTPNLSRSSLVSHTRNRWSVILNRSYDITSFEIKNVEQFFMRNTRLSLQKFLEFF